MVFGITDPRVKGLFTTFLKLLILLEEMLKNTPIPERGKMYTSLLINIYYSSKCPNPNVLTLFWELGTKVQKRQDLSLKNSLKEVGFESTSTKLIIK